MPVYALKCKDCGEKFNISASIKEKEEKKTEKFNCPKCGSGNTAFKFSLSNLFRGGSGGCCADGGCCG